MKSRATGRASSSGRKHSATSPPVLSLVNLGCAKNLVDSERILGQFAEAGFLIAQNPAEAEICIVNTCGFIAEAREETAAVLGELAQLKHDGRLKALVAVGCLVERVAGVPEFDRFLRAADVRLGFKDYPRLAQICRELSERARRSSRKDAKDAKNSRNSESLCAFAPLREASSASYNDFLVAPRLRIGALHSAYLKISEGCSNACRFCSIPRMRGLQVSRPIEKLVQEARELADGGAREILLIAQDTTSYGRDLYGSLRLADLLRALLTVRGPRWFRLMYAYPRHLTAEMLDVLASDERFCPYIDLPLQHISDPLLQAMGRGVTRRQTIELLDLVARKLPGGALRTTFIVGYPGETEAQFHELLDFVHEGRFTHAGVFLYSSEPLTPAAQAPDTVPLAEKKARRDALMQAQREVSRRRLSARVGQTVELLVDGPVAAPNSVKGARMLARSRLEAPEVDGVIYLKGRGAGKLQPGAVVHGEIVQALDYDLVARVGGDRLGE